MACPDQAILGQNLVCTIQAKNTSGSPVDTDSLPTYSVYEDETTTAILTGTMSKLDDDNTTGFYSELLAITAANGFELFKSYTIRYSAEIGATALSHQDTFNVVQTALSATTTSSALTTVAHVKTYTGITTSDDDDLLTALIARATSMIYAFCGRTLLSATYRERYDGTGDRDLWLNETPITAITMVSLGLDDLISVQNTNSDAYNAHASVDTTNLELVVQGGTNDGTDTLTLADYTATQLVAAINALGTGWAAVLLISDDGVWESAELLPIAGLNAFDSAIAYLIKPQRPASGYRFEAKPGRLHTTSIMPEGVQNITVKYTAGYATTPADLEQITIDVVNTYYLSRERDTTVMEEKLGDHAVKYSDGRNEGSSYRDLPMTIQRRLAPYKRLGFAV